MPCSTISSNVLVEAGFRFESIAEDAPGIEPNGLAKPTVAAGGERVFEIPCSIIFIYCRSSLFWRISKFGTTLVLSGFRSQYKMVRGVQPTVSCSRVPAVCRHPCGRKKSRGTLLQALSTPLWNTLYFLERAYSLTVVRWSQAVALSRVDTATTACQTVSPTN